MVRTCISQKQTNVFNSETNDNVSIYLCKSRISFCNKRVYLQMFGSRPFGSQAFFSNQTCASFRSALNQSWMSNQS